MAVVRTLLRVVAMNTPRFVCCCLIVLSSAAAALAQSPADAPPPPPPPPPLWDAQIGASFVGTNGNSDTASTGVDFIAHRRGPVWRIESQATAVRTNSQDATTAERYLGMLRGERKLTPIVGLSSGAKFERDRFSGLDFRSILDAGFSWALVHRPEWTLDGLSSIAWLHESRTCEGQAADCTATGLNDPVAVLQALSRIPFGSGGDSTQRFTYYPDLKTVSAYRSEAEVTVQAAMNAHLALKIGYLLRYSNQPVPGFKKTDNTTTASVVVRWKAATSAPAP
jgi:putative salt-induced outer membrane protein